MPHDDLSIDQIIREGLVRAHYQPIVDLESRETVAHEALARGPVGTRYERPDLLFAAARTGDRLGDLDWLCRRTAVEGALEAGLASDHALFLNVEPEALSTPAPEAIVGLIDRAAASLRLVLEITERSLLRDPASLLAAVDVARASGWGIALDDVGADPDSLSLMPFLRPDVVKLDLRIIQSRPDREAAKVMSAVLAEAERNGSTILAEGIETQEHLDAAIALGATYGQGWLFARPAPTFASIGRPTRPIETLTAPETTPATPFGAVEGRRTTRVARKELLLSMTLHLERNAFTLNEPPIVLSTFQTARHFTPATAGRYQALAATSAFVGALADGLPRQPTPGVRGTSFDRDDRLRGEWDVLVVSPHYAAGLLARDLGDEGADDNERRFEYVVTHDRDLVLRAARSLIARIAAR